MDCCTVVGGLCAVHVSNMIGSLAPCHAIWFAQVWLGDGSSHARCRGQQTICVWLATQLISAPAQRHSPCCTPLSSDLTLQSDILDEGIASSAQRHGGLACCASGTCASGFGAFQKSAGHAREATPALHPCPGHWRRGVTRANAVGDAAADLHASVDCATHLGVGSCRGFALLERNTA